MSYSIVDDKVRITARYSFSFSSYAVCLDRDGLLRAIQNIKDNRRAYASQRAYQSDLALYENALQFLDGRRPPA